jgi:hypothetical protein
MKDATGAFYEIYRENKRLPPALGPYASCDLAYLLTVSGCSLTNRRLIAAPVYGNARPGFETSARMLKAFFCVMNFDGETSTAASIFPARRTIGTVGTWRSGGTTGNRIIERLERFEQDQYKKLTWPTSSFAVISKARSKKAVS